MDAPVGWEIQNKWHIVGRPKSGHANLMDSLPLYKTKPRCGAGKHWPRGFGFMEAKKSVKIQKNQRYAFACMFVIRVGSEAYRPRFDASDHPGSRLGRSISSPHLRETGSSQRCGPTWTGRWSNSNLSLAPAASDAPSASTASPPAGAG